MFTRASIKSSSTIDPFYDQGAINKVYGKDIPLQLYEAINHEKALSAVCNENNWIHKLDTFFQSISPSIKSPACRALLLLAYENSWASGYSKT